MYRLYSLKWKPLVLSLLISLGAGGLSALITGDTMDTYKTLNLPPLSPPGIVFPIVWTILYSLMGISAYLIYTSDSRGKTLALGVYLLQLLINVLWSPVFFNSQNFLLAFLLLVLLWILIAVMIALFYRINKTAALLQIPYLLWVTFAGYLNLAIYLLNR